MIIKIMIQKMLTVILAIMIIVKGLVMIIVVKVEIGIDLYSLKLISNWLFLILIKWISSVYNVQVISHFVANR